MGYSRWDYAETTASYASAVSSRSTQTRQEIFKQRECLDAFNPALIGMRESRDSEHNPLSTPIIVGLDVTGSMGVIAEKMAHGELGKLMNGIFDRKPVTDPHVMVMAIGDATCDMAPLQVSQFEADIRIDNSLQDLYLEGRGGGNSFESYDLPWYFAATRTSTDAYEKRGKKGYLFTIGDEQIPPASPYSTTRFEQVFGPCQDASTYNSRVALANAQEKYHVFHIIVEQGNHCVHGHRDLVVNGWTSVLGKRALPLNNWEHLSELILAAIEVNEGADPVDIIKSFQDAATRKTLHHAFGA
jgi:hypothetical protein